MPKVETPNPVSKPYMRTTITVDPSSFPAESVGGISFTELTPFGGSLGLDPDKYGSNPISKPEVFKIGQVCTSCRAKHNASDKHHDSCDYCRSYYE